MTPGRAMEGLKPRRRGYYPGSVAELLHVCIMPRRMFFLLATHAVADVLGLRRRSPGTTIMFYFTLLLICLTLTAAALYFLLRTNELSSRLHQAGEEWRQKEAAYASELARLEKNKHALETDIIERVRRAKEEVEAKLASQFRQAREEWRREESAYTSELAKLGKIRHIPDILEKARRAKEEVEAKLA
jgi:hypothetical protein